MKKAHWLFPSSGAAYGLAFWYLVDHDWGDGFYLASLMTFITALAFCSWFVIGVQRLRDDVAFTIAIPALAALQVGVFQMFVGFSHIDEVATVGLLTCQALWVGVAVAAWRLWARVQKTAQSNYPGRAALVPEIWSIKLSLAFGAVGVGILWPMLFALCALLSLVGMVDIWDFISEGYIAMPLSGGGAATGILIAHEKSNLLIPVRQVIGGMFRVLYPIQAMGLFVFLLAAALGRWEVLLAQDFGVWWIVMGAAAGLSYLLFGAVQAGEGTTLFGRIGDRVFRFTLWMAPVFGAIAIYTIWWRVSNYGLTPSRVYALWAALFVSFATICLAVAAFGRNQSTPVSLRRAFGHISICLAVMAFVIHLPLLDPVTMSARSQKARLINATDMNKADLSFIARKLGLPGEAVLAELSVLAPDVVPALADLREHFIDNSDVIVDADSIPIFPETYQVPTKAVKKLLNDHLEFDRRFCGDGGAAQDNVCALLMVDMDRDGVEEAVFLSKQDYARIYQYDAAGEEWLSVGNLYVDIKDGDRSNMIRDLANGAFDVIAPRYFDLKIGERELRQNP